MITHLTTAVTVCSVRGHLVRQQNPYCNSGQDMDPSRRSLKGPLSEGPETSTKGPEFDGKGPIKLPSWNFSQMYGVLRLLSGGEEESKLESEGRHCPF